MLQNHTFYPALGGIENYLYHVSKTLKEMGHQPIILCEKHHHKLSDFETYDGIKIIRHPYYNIPKRLLFMKPKIISEKLKHFISEHVVDIDLIISRYAHYCFATCSLNQDIPIFYIPPSVFWKQLKEGSSKLSLKSKFFNLVWKKILSYLEKESILKSDKTVVLSKNMSESLRSYYKLRSAKFYIIPAGVDLHRFCKSKDLQLLEELNISQNDIILLYVGRLSPDKNVERLIKEFQFLIRSGLKLLIVGFGSDRARLEKMKDDMGLDNEIVFLGPRTDVERFYSIADIFISPSKHEPFGQVILEAMASGLPCIAFKRVLPEYEVAAEEIIVDGVTGFCVDPYNKHEFHDRLQYLIGNSDVRKSMGEAGRKVCERKYTWNNHVQQLLELMNLRLDKEIN